MGSGKPYAVRRGGEHPVLQKYFHPHSVLQLYLFDVLPGNKLEIHSPELPVGEPVEVFVVLSKNKQANRENVLDLIESIRSKRLFRTPEDIDRQLQEERNSRDS
jgi:hypothetical protein